MNINYKKSLKLITLLITSLLIGLASAATYSELFMYGTTISIGTASVRFTDGANTTSISTAGISGTGAQVTFDNILAIEAGEIRTYEQAVNITNSAGATKTLNVTVESLTGNFSTNFDYLNITVLNGTGSPQGDSIIVSSGLNVTFTGSLPMTNNAVWIVRWIIKAKSDATDAESFSVTLKVKVE
jgi:hypothetical protein